MFPEMYKITRRNNMFPEMYKIIPEGKIGIAEIKHRTPSKHDCEMAALRRKYLEPRTLATLFVDGVMMMSDGPMEHDSNFTVVNKARGDVLIAGLGIGMIVAAILQKPEVGLVTIIEKYQDVIDLVMPHMPRQCVYVCTDIFDWKPAKGEKFDTIYFDIWPNICTDNLVEINKLHQRFKSYKAKDGWMGSWNQDLLRYHKRIGR